MDMGEIKAVLFLQILRSMSVFKYRMLYVWISSPDDTVG